MFCTKYSPFVQEDAAEFLLHIIDKFSSDNNCKGIFNGKIRTHFHCSHCGEKSELTQDFTVLNVPLSKAGWEGGRKISNKMARGFGEKPKFKVDGNGSFGNHLVSFFQHMSVSRYLLENCLQSMFSPSSHECEKCHKQLDMFSALESLPEVLIIQLGRFGKRWFGLGKVYQYVSFPDEDVDFQEFVQEDIDCGPSLYSLVAVVLHSGFMNSGHYQCYAKKYGTNKWFLYNDDQVTSVSKEEVINTEGYLLFYQKKTPKEVDNIRKAILNKKSLPSWLGTPIKIFSDPKMWKESIPLHINQNEDTKNDDNDLNEKIRKSFPQDFIDILEMAKPITNETLVREETEYDKKERLINLYHHSKSFFHINQQSGWQLFEFIFEKGPLPKLKIATPDEKAPIEIGDEASFLISNEEETNEENSNKDPQNDSHKEGDTNEQNHKNLSDPANEKETNQCQEDKHEDNDQNSSKDANTESGQYNKENINE